MDKKAVVHLHNGILLSHKKEEILPFSTAWMELLSEISLSEKDKHNLISLIYESNKLTNKIETDSYIQRTD